MPKKPKKSTGPLEPAEPSDLYVWRSKSGRELRMWYPQRLGQPKASGPWVSDSSAAISA